MSHISIAHRVWAAWDGISQGDGLWFEEGEKDSDLKSYRQHGSGSRPITDVALPIINAFHNFIYVSQSLLSIVAFSEAVEVVTTLELRLPWARQAYEASLSDDYESLELHKLAFANSAVVMLVFCCADSYLDSLLPPYTRTQCYRDIKIYLTTRVTSRQQQAPHRKRAEQRDDDRHTEVMRNPVRDFMQGIQTPTAISRCEDHLEKQHSEAKSESHRVGETWITNKKAKHITTRQE
ncbi:hypothetical protein E6O75_ATG03937 [Venturia nashicola]|uniref:Uncharacterized protein n=1 Tax=Venturia nashicola TaxID=86259 RepID=A0A4Z1PTA9_9PEZI|nr:hypothetical protein E6O75_ATG03937 [Venturia nashicola]